MKVPFQFHIYSEPEFIYTGEMVIDKFFVTWEPQHSRLLGGWIDCPPNMVEYTVEEMRDYFEKGVWLLVE